MDVMKIKLLIITLLLFSATGSLTAQDVKESPEYKREKQVYNQGLKYGDVNVARNALYNLMALDPQDISLLDSLAFLYFDYQRHTSCILVCLDLLSINPDNLAALEMSAISYENLGLKDKALERYESIYLKRNNVFTLYKVAALQFELDRLVESMTNVSILLEHQDSKDAKITLSSQQGGAQEIQILAAVYNLKGLIEKQQDKKDAARVSFNEALAIAPDFSLAKTNLESLE